MPAWGVVFLPETDHDLEGLGLGDGSAAERIRADILTTFHDLLRPPDWTPRSKATPGHRKSCASKEARSLKAFDSRSFKISEPRFGAYRPCTKR